MSQQFAQLQEATIKQHCKPIVRSPFEQHSRTLAA
jgi:hypothetical protein